MFMRLISKVFEARLAVSGKKYLRLAVSGWYWSPNSYYTYHWYIFLIAFSVLTSLLRYSIMEADCDTCV